MNEKQCYHIKSPALCLPLKVSGLPSNTQRDIVAGPLASLGISNRIIYGTQGIKQIMALINFGKTNSITGKQFRDSLEITNMELGCSGPLLIKN